jgi:hypothetical protein
VRDGGHRVQPLKLLRLRPRGVLNVSRNAPTRCAKCVTQRTAEVCQMCNATH